MREDLLQFIWRYRKFRINELHTADGLKLHIRKTGSLNRSSGPDFFNASVEIGGQLWVGNIEIHVRSSDWYLHGHQTDTAYDNVILHVVWTNDRQVFSTMGRQIPTLVLRHYVDVKLLDRYRRLLLKANRKFINCESFSGSFSIFVVLPWLEHPFHERLQVKLAETRKILVEINGDWERLIFIMLLKYFGQRVNKEIFLNLARRIDHNAIRRIGVNPFRLESLFYGQIGLLADGPVNDSYYQSLCEEYNYIKRKYNIDDIPGKKPEFMGVRPVNFPTIRLSQFAVLITGNQNLFSRILQMETKRQYYEFFSIEATSYWDTHHSFGKSAAFGPKRLSRVFIDSLIINAILPVKFLYHLERGKDCYPRLRDMAAKIRVEDNNLIRKFRSLGLPAKNAMDSQALLQLYNSYCSKNRCLECALGNQILN